MYRIELYGIGYKNKKSIDNIIGICYITKLKKSDTSTPKMIVQEKRESRSLMNIANINNEFISGGDVNIISSTLNIKDDRATVFGIKFNKIVSDVQYKKTYTFLNKFPTLLILELKDI